MRVIPQWLGPAGGEHRCRIKIRKGEDGHHAVYSYDWSPDLKCSFTLLCECAHSLIPVFERMLEAEGLEISKEVYSHKDINGKPVKPWISDRIIWKK